jgi:hypothetical protein
VIEDQVGQIKRVIDTQLYAVDEDSVVTLTIRIGNQQQGGSSYVYAGKTVVGTPNFEDRPINSKQRSPKTTVLNCVTRVVDVRPETDATSVTYILRGGVAEKRFAYRTDVTQNHGIAMYLVNFFLI